MLYKTTHCISIYSFQQYVTQVVYMDIVLENLTTVSVTVYTQEAHAERVIISK